MEYQHSVFMLKVEQGILYELITDRWLKLIYVKKYIFYKISIFDMVWYNFMGWGKWEDQSAAGNIVSMKNSNDTIKNRTRDLLACSTVPQPTAPLCAHVIFCHTYLRLPVTSTANRLNLISFSLTTSQQFFILQG